MTDRIILVDGNHNLHRSCHVPALASLSHEGVRTGGVYGFLNSIRDTLRVYPSDRVIVVWDGGRSERRMKLFPEYKPRPDPKVDKEYADYLEFFQSSRDFLEPILHSLGIISVRMGGREADDILGFLTWHHKESNFVIMTEDLDLAQMVDDHVVVWRPVRREEINLACFKDRLGVKPIYYRLFKAIVGDGSDGIPGIKGVGDVTAKIACGIYETNEPSAHKAKPVSLIAIAEHKSARVRKIAENWAIVEKNYELMDILREEFTPEEKEYLNDLPTRRIGTFCELEVIRILNRLDIRSITNDWTRWSEPFLRLAYAS